jgi:hypothetical protein
MAIDNGHEECQLLHGLECEPDVIPLPEHLAELLPKGEFVEYGECLRIDYRWPGNNREYFHNFTNATVLVAGPGILYVIGDFHVTPDGIVNSQTPEE